MTKPFFIPALGTFLLLLTAQDVAFAAEEKTTPTTPTTTAPAPAKKALTFSNFEFKEVFARRKNGNVSRACLRGVQPVTVDGNTFRFSEEVSFHANGSLFGAHISGQHKIRVGNHAFSAEGGLGFYENGTLNWLGLSGTNTLVVGGFPLAIHEWVQFYENGHLMHVDLKGANPITLGGQKMSIQGRLEFHNNGAMSSVYSTKPIVVRVGVGAHAIKTQRINLNDNGNVSGGDYLVEPITLSIGNNTVKVMGVDFRKSGDLRMVRLSGDQKISVGGESYTLKGGYRIDFYEANRAHRATLAPGNRIVFNKDGSVQFIGRNKNK